MGMGQKVAASNGNNGDKNTLMSYNRRQCDAQKNNLEHIRQGGCTQDARGLLVDSYACVARIMFMMRLSRYAQDRAITRHIGMVTFPCSIVLSRD